jgi:uncharacterized repeat protein (TIGR03803 family)
VKQKKNPSILILISRIACIFAVLASLSLCARAQAAETVIHAFDRGGDGVQPVAGLTSDEAGSFYGTTDFGGAYNEGSVFELTPTATGWSESVIYSFPGGASGFNPNYAGVVVDSSGNLYGTTYSGGTSSSACNEGCGVVFELSPTSSGWVETVIHSFTGADGSNPGGGLIFDSSGNLYGVTGLGGPSGTGVVFKLAPSAGTWTESVLYAFPDTGKSGVNPWGVSMGADGNLYGTAVYGGTYGFGAVFKLAPNTTGGWTKSTIHAFTGGAESGFSRTGLIFDAAGNIYGMTSGQPGGAGNGAVFKLTPTSGGGWKSSVLHSFTGGKDGGFPAYNLTFDAAGNLYGATLAGGNVSGCENYGCGVAFKLTPTPAGAWKETVLHTFTGRNDGANPNGVILDAAGNLWGTTVAGGANKYGVVFEITP